MRFPREKMQIASVFEGKSPENGWLVLDISKLDLDGVARLYVSLDDVEAVRLSRDNEADALDQARKLLGGE